MNQMGTVLFNGIFVITVFCDVASKFCFIQFTVSVVKKDYPFFYSDYFQVSLRFPSSFAD